jgi:A/G-specific adenine glycosylase
MNEKRYPEFQEQLLRWFDAHQRDLPWRRDYSPYAVWISEIMLQQTQVKTVLPFFERWMERFPDLSRVALASHEEILKCWEGLGYYSRAKNIHKTAHIIVREHGGEFPREHRTLLKLPGIGHYTAGAIMSLAFGEDYAAVDGNVERVLARIFNVAAPVNEAANRGFFRKTAQDLIPAGEGRRFNQALMELGALVCAPANPRCPACPVVGLCESNRLGIVDQRPVRSKRNPSVPVEAAVGAIIHEGRILIQKRPPTGLMADLWEFPGGKIRNGETPEEALVRELREELELEIRCLDKITVIRHSYTSFRVTLHAFFCAFQGPPRTPVLRAASEARWVSPEQLDDYAFPAANRRLITLLKKSTEWTPSQEP